MCSNSKGPDPSREHQLLTLNWEEGVLAQGKETHFFCLAVTATLQSDDSHQLYQYWLSKIFLLKYINIDVFLRRTTDYLV